MQVETYKMVEQMMYLEILHLLQYNMLPIVYPNMMNHLLMVLYLVFTHLLLLKQFV